jgi:hypothetical protein
MNPLFRWACPIFFFSSFISIPLLVIFFFY